jgi:hypothetical protein
MKKYIAPVTYSVITIALLLLCDLALASKGI